jgi:filamentous hemagglutinin
MKLKAIRALIMLLVASLFLAPTASWASVVANDDVRQEGAPSRTAAQEKGDILFVAATRPKKAQKPRKGSLNKVKSGGITKRPSSFRKSTVHNAWKNAAPGKGAGTKRCPTCKKDVRGDPTKGQGRKNHWDVDHQPPWSKRNLAGMNRKQVLNNYNKGTRLECAHCNRSRGARPAGQPKRRKKP